MSCVCGKCGRTDKCPADVTEDVSGCLQMIATRRKRRRGENSCLPLLVCLGSLGMPEPLQKVLRPVARPHLEQEATRLCWQASSSRIGHISFISDGTLLEESSTLGVVAGGDPCGSLQRRVVQEKLADRVGHE